MTLQGSETGIFFSVSVGIHKFDLLRIIAVHDRTAHFHRVGDFSGHYREMVGEQHDALDFFKFGDVCLIFCDF